MLFFVLKEASDAEVEGQCIADHWGFYPAFICENSQGYKDQKWSTGRESATGSLHE